MQNDKSWKKYEQVTSFILNKLNDVKNELQLSRIEQKQRLKGKSGNLWEVDAVGYDAVNGKPVPIECKLRSKDKIPQNALADFAYRIHDVGCERGIMVTTIGLQEGAKKIAITENIEIIKLNKNATADRFDLVLPNRGQHHLGLGGKAKLKDEVTLIEIRDSNGNIVKKDK